MSEKSLSKKFSIGLNLTPDENDNRKLLEDYHQYLSSLYFSFPMGMQYYSRLGIKDEFQDEDSAQRLFNVLTYAKELGVRRELALNTYHLSDLDIDYAIEFTKKFGIIPEEIVCLKEYGEKIRKAFPNCELKFEDAIPLFIDLIDQLYAHNQNTTTKVIWHGGEPMLIRPQLMEQVMLDQLQKGHDIRWEMQSNGTLVTEEHIRVFQKYKVSVGVSIDGLKKHHDKYRIFKNGNPTYDVIMKNTQRLRNSGISCGTLLTITDENVNDLPEIYQELCKKNLNFSFNALFPSKADDDVTLNDNNYARKICELFDTWIQDEKNGIGIHPFERIMQCLINAEQGDPGCHWRPDCSKSFVAIDCNGDLYPCEHWVGYSDYCFGNIREGLENALVKNQYFDHRTEELQKSDCKNCPVWAMCYGGCPWSAMTGTGNVNRKDPSICIARQVMVKHIYQYMCDNIPKETQ